MIGDESRTERASTMRTSSGLGHNSRTTGGGRMYAIVFDLDTRVLQELNHNAHYNNAHAVIKKYLTTRGFEWKQGSTYFGDDTIDAVRCVRTVQKLSAKFPWFKPAVRDIRMLRIEENNDLTIALDDDDD
jgi:virulence-associated protein VapD